MGHNTNKSNDDNTGRNKVIPFTRDVNYYFQKGNRHFYSNNWPKALLYFKKAIEIEPEEPLNHYNLGCLLSKMGELEEANKVFAYILENLDDSYWECYFLLAINYGLMEEFEMAQSYLRKYLNNSPDGEMIIEAQELLWALTDDEPDTEEEIDEIFYREIKEEITLDLKTMTTDNFVEKYEGNTFLLQILKRILYQGNDLLKDDAINILGYMNNRETAGILQEFVRNPWAKDRHKQIALLKIKSMNFHNRCLAFLKGKTQEIDLKKYPLMAPRWKEEWQRVLNCTLKKMRYSNNYNENFFEDVQAMWIDFINRKNKDMPKIKKYETWAAGLEYSLARFHFLKVTQKEIAEKYGVSSASVSKKYKILNEILKIDQKAYQNMLVYLTQAEKGE